MNMLKAMSVKLIHQNMIFDLIKKKHNKNKNLHSLRSFGRANSARPFYGRYAHEGLKFDL